jgi:hypothetical protein
MGDQPALRTSSGTVWLVVGGVLAALCIVLLLALNPLQHPVGLVGAGIVLVLYVFMVVAVLAITDRRARLVTLAILMIGIAIAGLVFVLIINATQWSAVG